MKTKNVTLEQLKEALDRVNNCCYSNNIEFKRLEKKGNNFIFTLRVKNSSGAGAKLTQHINADGNHRKSCAACWHVHGDFFDVLFIINPQAKIISLGKEITKEAGNWKDWNIGSYMQPYYCSEACHCRNL